MENSNLEKYDNVEKMQRQKNFEENALNFSIGHCDEF